MAIVAVPTLLGYVSRRFGLLSERVGEWVMIFVGVVGYPAVAFLSIWGESLEPVDAWLPAIGGANVCVMMVLGLLVGRLVARERSEVGLFGIASSMGNTGFTMGGLVMYFLYGVAGLRLVSIYCLMWTPVMVLLLFPVARHYTGRAPRGALWKLLLRSIFDWRAIALPATIVAIVLSWRGVQQPAVIAQWRVVDVLMYTITPAAFFGIGLRLHVSYVGALKKMILALAGMRFVVGAALGLAFCAATALTPWKLTGMHRNVIIIESFTPVAITAVAIANMFGLKPREASALFVTSTLAYVVVIVPLVLWIFGG